MNSHQTAIAAIVCVSILSSLSVGFFKAPADRVRKRLRIPFSSRATPLVVGALLAIAIASPKAVQAATSCFVGQKQKLTALLPLFLALVYSKLLRDSNWPQRVATLLVSNDSEISNKRKFAATASTAGSGFVLQYALTSANAAIATLATGTGALFRRVGLDDRFAASVLLASTWGSVLNSADIVYTTALVSEPSFPQFNLLPALVGIVIATFIMLLATRRQPSAVIAMNASAIDVRTTDDHEPGTPTDWKSVLIPLLPFVIFGVMSSVGSSKTSKMVVFLLAIALWPVLTRTKLAGWFQTIRAGAKTELLTTVPIVIGTWVLVAVGMAELEEHVSYLQVAPTFGAGALTLAAAVFLVCAMTGASDTIIPLAILSLLPGSAHWMEHDRLLAISSVWVSGEMGRCCSPNSLAAAAASQVVATDQDAYDTWSVAGRTSAIVIPTWIVVMILECLRR
jgi:hypothetical protein